MTIKVYESTKKTDAGGHQDSVTGTIDLTSEKLALDTLPITSLVKKAYDYIDLDYTGADLTTVTYRNGGAGGTLVATITLGYTSGILQTVSVANV